MSRQGVLVRGKNFSVDRALCAEPGAANTMIIRTVIFLLASCWGLETARAQTAQIVPSELSLVPVAGLGDDRYWQQIEVTLAADDQASDQLLTVELPEGMSLVDDDGDGAYDDEVRVVYDAVGDEQPALFVAGTTSAQRIAIGSAQMAAAGGRIYVQFACSSPVAPVELSARYGRIDFADEAEVDLPEGPQLSYVTQEDFSALGSMQVVRYAPVLGAQTDTSAAPIGQFFPDVEHVLIDNLPDLVFDGGTSSSGDALELGDGDDTNDVEYRFFFSTIGNLTRVDEDAAVEATIASGDPYIEREGAMRLLRLDISRLPPGVHYLYVTAAQTGSIPLARSRGISVMHAPQFTALDPQQDITLDSGGLYDAAGRATGEGVRQVVLEYELIDLDDAPDVFLYYSVEEALDSSSLSVDGVGAVLANVTALTPGALPGPAGAFTWDILAEGAVPEGDYYIYAVSSDGTSTTMQRSAGSVRVRHSPFLRLDPLNDRAHTGIDTIRTGGLHPQRYITFSWDRSGIDGDEDIDDDARIDLYYSSAPAETQLGEGGFSVPGGASQMLAALNEGRAELIFGDIPEDPDGRTDNQYAWDLWALSGEGASLPQEEIVYYAYGMISDGENRRLAQMNGGHLNDAASQMVFLHPPSILPVQPVAPVVVSPGLQVRTTWEDVDLDDDARIRVLLSGEDIGPHPLYGEVSAVRSYVVNSADGRADIGVDALFDLSEDSPTDHYDFGVDHLARGISTDAGLEDGEYTLYLAIADGNSFADAQCWRAPGVIQVQGLGEEPIPTAPIRLLPERFSMGNGGALQVFEVRVDAGEEVDLVQASFVVDGGGFAVVDQDEVEEGIQPFVVSSGFSAAKLVSNRLSGEEGGPQILTLEYFEPTAGAIAGLGSDRTLATFQLRSLGLEGPTAIELAVEGEGGDLSRLQRDGLAVVELVAAPLSQGELVAGRAVLRGVLQLEGRTDMTSQATVTLRTRGDYRPYGDVLFAETNDVDVDAGGVQVDIAADGSFELSEVPTGRWDLHVHVDGYIEGIAADLTLYSGLVLEDVIPASVGTQEVPRLLGGDVTGFVGENGVGIADNEVTLADWDYVAAFFGAEVVQGDGSAQADITGDGRVDIGDLSLVGANFMRRGAQPVYKIVPDAQPVHIEYAQGAGPVRAGEESTWAVRARGAEGARAFALQLHYDPSQWEWVAVRGADESPALAALTDRPYGKLWGQVLIGRLGALVGSDGRIAEWTLRARIDNPDQPQLRADVFVDRADLAMSVIGHEEGRLTRLPQALRLEQNAPNPFNPETTIAFAVPAPGRVRLEVFDVLGQRVARIWDGVLGAGQYSMRWDGRDASGRSAASGVYIYRIESDHQVLSKRMVLVR